MRPLFIFVFLIVGHMAQAGFIQEGVFVGQFENGKSCQIEITHEGEFAYVGRSEFRLTIHRKGPFVKCLDYEGVQYEGCASGEHTNGKNDKALYILGSQEKGIEKMYIEGEKLKTCVF